MMFETNTASCAGFPGLSDSFGAALWGIDWAMTMVANGFSMALFHVGGKNAYYNPFTPPPTNQTKYGVQWTVGPIYYSALAMAEALGPKNQSQVSDITQDINTPMYAIFENGVPTKVALFNFVTDPSGASTYTAVISVGGGTTGQSNATPSSVKVKYVLIWPVKGRNPQPTLSVPQISLGRICIIQRRLHLGRAGKFAFPHFGPTPPFPPFFCLATSCSLRARIHAYFPHNRR